MQLLFDIHILGNEPSIGLYYGIFLNDFENNLSWFIVFWAYFYYYYFF
jgi:hypothetical protein